MVGGRAVKFDMTTIQLLVFISFMSSFLRDRTSYILTYFLDFEQVKGVSTRYILADSKLTSHMWNPFLPIYRIARAYWTRHHSRTRP